jgi:hypothetical protein
VSDEAALPPESRSPRLAIALDILSYLTAPLVYGIVAASDLSITVALYCESAYPEHPHPCGLARPYGVALALATLGVVVGLVAFRLVLSRKRFYVPLPAIAVALAFAREIESRFLFN